jgi:hypothetical protein
MECVASTLHTTSEHGVSSIRCQLKCDGTHAETRFRLLGKWTSLFKSTGTQFSRLLAAELCASALVMLDTPSSEVVRRVLATHSIRQFPLHFPSRASPCAITFQLESTTADAPVSAASVRLNCRPRRFKRTRPFRRKKNSGFCACVITFQTQSTLLIHSAQRSYVARNSHSTLSKILK